MQRLSTFATTELLTEELWPFTAKVLHQALLDADARVVTLALKVYARSFANAPIQMACETYRDLLYQVATSWDALCCSVNFKIDLKSEKFTLEVKKVRVFFEILQTLNEDRGVYCYK
jgi:hypothetical protein